MYHNAIGNALKIVRAEKAAAAARALSSPEAKSSKDAASDVYEDLGSKASEVAIQIFEDSGGGNYLALRVNGAEHKNGLPTDREFDAYPIPFYMIIESMKGKWEDWFTYIAENINVTDPGICIFISEQGPGKYDDEYTEGQDYGITKFGRKLTKAKTKNVIYYAINSDDRNRDDDGNITGGVKVSFLKDKMRDWIRQYEDGASAGVGASAGAAAAPSKSGGVRKKKRRKTRKKTRKKRVSRRRKRKSRRKTKRKKKKTRKKRRR